jgi:3-ketosteroid 9alpha-monooxygenase subunit A
LPIGLSIGLSIEANDDNATLETVAADPGLASERFPFPAYSNGWARVALSEDLRARDCETMRYFGRELQLLRSASGAPHVYDAECPNARLDSSGEAQRCDRHGWPVCEQNGFIFVWYHGAGIAPDCEVPELPEHTDPEWSPYMRLRWRIRSRGYDMGENTVDDVHFHYLHGAASLPKTDAGDLMGTKSVNSKMKMKSPLGGEVDASIENTSVPGMGIVHLRGICDTLIVITSAPIDGDYVDQMFSYKQRTGGDDKLERIGKAFLRDLEKQMNEDIVCFEHKRYWLRPLLVEDDGAIAQYRRRARKSYTGDFLESSAGADWDARTPPVPQLLSAPKRPVGFEERDFEELASFLRSRFRARRVERVDHEEERTVELRLLGREDALMHVIVFERGCLERHPIADLRAWLAKPLAKQRIELSAGKPFAVPSIEIL